MRFSLYSPLYPVSHHPILAICNTKSKIFFFDLARLEAYQEYITAISSSSELGRDVKRPPFLLSPGSQKRDHAFDRLRAEGSPGSSSPVSTTSDILLPKADTRKAWEERYAMGTPETSLKAHKIETVPRFNITGRQVAWSAGGEWCVVVGTPNVIALLHRWG